MFPIKAGSTSKSVLIKLVDSSTFLAKTGLLFSDLTIYYTVPGTSAVATTPATLAAANSAWSSGGFKEVDATNSPGLYRFDPPNAALATGPGVVLTFKAASTKDEALLIPLPAYDPYDAVHLGLSAIPNATAGAANGLFIAGANAATTVNITGTLSGAVGSVTGSVGSVVGITAADVGAIRAKTDNLPADPSSAAGLATAIPAAVLAAATSTPIKAEIKKINNITINGSGVLGDPFKP